IDFTDIDIRYKQAYENRTFANKQVEAETLKLQPIDENLESAPLPYLELQKELAGIDSHNDKYQYVVNGIKEKETTKQSLFSEIERLKSLIKEAEDKITDLSIEIDKGNDWLNTPANQPKTEEEAIRIQNEINTIVEKNK